MRKAFLLLAIQCLLAWTPAFGQATQPSQPYDRSTPLAADASLTRAYTDRDLQAIRKSYSAETDDERAMLNAMVDGEKASADLNQACVDRFHQGLPPPPKGNGHHEAKITGDHAVIFPSGAQSTFGVPYDRINGEWRIPMRAILKMHVAAYKTLQKAIDNQQSWAKQLQRVTAEVRAGKYTSPAEVDRRVGDLADADDTPTTQK